MPESRRRTRRGRQVGRGSRANDSLSMTRPRRRKANYWYVGASAIIAVLVIGGFAVGGLNFGGSGGGMAQHQQGIGDAHPIMADTYPDPHVPEGAFIEYSTTPPTSGKHWDRWAQCDFYAEGLPDERITHNLEHSNIVVSYNLTDPGEVDDLRAVLENTDRYRFWGLARYYDKIPQGQVALSTWGVLETMEGIDAERIQRFFDAYANALGPERVDCREAPFSMEQ